MNKQDDVIDLDGAVWLRRHALADGLTDREIARLVRTGAWHRVRRGAYCSAELWQGLSAADRHRILCRAVLLAAHPTTVLSHVSAAVERGVPVWGVMLDEVHTTRTDGRCGRRESGVRHHRGDLTEEEVEEVNGVRVTSAARCVVESCTLAGVEAGVVIANGALSGGHASYEGIIEFAERARFWPESLGTRLVTGLMHPKIESVGESRAWYLFWSEHLPRPEPQVTIVDETGRVVARLDFAWPSLGVFLEFDGREKYLRFRRPGETLDDYLMREKKRQERVCLITGWVCLRITWADLEQPKLLARRIRKVLAARAPQTG